MGIIHVIPRSQMGNIKNNTSLRMSSSTPIRTPECEVGKISLRINYESSYKTNKLDKDYKHSDPKHC
jgi:hypothetical protein